jgi:ferredoxin
MPTLLIDAQRVEAQPGATLLEAARQAGIVIPTLCHLPEKPNRQAGCLVCIVEDLDTGQLVPACVTRAVEGARIATNSPRVREARRQTLALLTGDHRADCEAPCRLACPSRLDIPRMMRALAAGDFRKAAGIVYETIALPHLLAAVCPAPCEKRCHRRDLDQPLAIRVLKSLAATHGRDTPAAPPVPGGKRVTIVGAGPAGLAAAFFLLQRGHACQLIEQQPHAGGALRNQPGFPETALERDLDTLRRLGATFAFQTRLGGRGETLASLAETCDALVLCCGEADAAPCARDLDLPLTHNHLAPLITRQVSRRLFPVFAAGAAIHPVRLAVIANAQGRQLAEKADAWLRDSVSPESPDAPRFRCHAGSLPSAALASMVNPACREAARQELTDQAPPDRIIREALRCLRCACLKADTCRLRAVCQAAELPNSHARHAERPVERILTGPGVVIEPAKCIACGICVRRSQVLGAPLGIAFHGRGYEVRIGPPVGHTWQELPADLLRDAADHCPTGAIALAFAGCGASAQTEVHEFRARLGPVVKTAEHGRGGHH